MSKNILSLFDGMSCGQIALTDMGIEIGQYYASEIDKHAVKMSQYLFPKMIHLGDVTKWEEWNIVWAKIDIVMGGSPCQGFSFAGKQLAFDDPRSKLFFVFVDILNHCKKHNPNVKFLLENVRMAKEHENVITRYMGIEPIFINSALVSAQNRQRLYWTNIFNEPAGLFSEPKCMIQQPKDRGILLKDILENEVPEKYFLSEKIVNKMFEGMNINGKSNTLRTSGHQSQSNKHNFDLIKIDKKGNIKDNQDKASCFTAGGNSGGNHSDMDLIVTHNLQPRNGKGQGGKGHLSKTDQKSYCLETSNGQAVEFREVRQLNTSLESRGKQPYMQNRIYDINGINPALTTLWNGSNLINTSKIRRLTPKECLRLQTVPEPIIDKMLNSAISDTQIYRMAGNGWTIEVIKHIFLYL